MIKLAFLTVVSAWAASGTPEPAALLRRATVVPAQSYEGRMTEVRWLGEKARTAEVDVASSKGELRREILGGGKKGRVSVSDGSDGWGIPAERKDLVLKNYSVTVAGEEPVAGRKAWILELKALEPGKPRRTLWVDEASGLILRAKRYDHEGTPASLSQFTRVALAAAAEPAPVETRRDAPAADTGVKPLSAGFAFESSATWTMAGNPVRQVRYTDGLAAVSLFESPAPVKLKELRGAAEGEGRLPRGSVVKWQAGKRHFVMIGDVSVELLRRLSADYRR